ncbi:hypothetical protein [Halioglobus japonicus]|uniref:hypothetical protein n=1 Tax=Halioglobus japonicus TaxID=930805 RepID=UPI001F0AFB1B|nr:hypothetical protein [Halioglobus japonicus]
MKLASLKSGRDGKLIVVSRDLSRAVSAETIAPTLQAALDDWAAKEPALVALYNDLNAGNCNGAFDFIPEDCAAPCPGLTTGRMAAPMSRTWSWCARPVAQNYPNLSGLTR